MVYEEQLQQIETAKQQLQQQRETLTKQQQFLENPNLLRKGGYGYLLAPAGKPQRIAAMQQIQSGFKSLAEYETGQLNPAEQQVKDAINRYNTAYQDYQEKLRRQEEARKSEIRAIVSYSKSQRPSSGKVTLPTGAAYVSPKTGKVYGSYADLYNAEYKPPKINVPPPSGVIKSTGSVATTTYVEGDQHPFSAVLRDITYTQDGKYTTQQKLPGVTVVDFGMEKQGGTGATKSKQGPSIPVSDTNFIPPDFETLILNLAGPPTAGESNLKTNQLYDYLAGLQTKVPTGKPAEPLPQISLQTGLERGGELAMNLPPVLLYKNVLAPGIVSGTSLQTGLERGQELAANLVPVKFFETISPPVQKGYAAAQPYIEKYFNENPLVQSVLLTGPLAAGKGQIQELTQKYPTEIIQGVNAVPFFRATGVGELSPYIISGVAEYIPTTPTELVKAGGIIGGGIYAAAAAPELFTLADIGIGTYGAYQTATAVTPEEKAAGVTNIALGGLGLGLSGYQYARKPVELMRELPPRTDILTRSKTVSLLKGEGLAGSEATFYLKAETPARYGYYSTKGNEFLRKLLGVSPESFGKSEVSKLTFEELKLLQPRGKVVEIAPAKSSLSYLPPSPIKEGQIETFIVSKSGTLKRLEPTIISKFMGITEDNRLLRLIDETKLDAITRKNLQVIQDLTKEKQVYNIPFKTKLIDDTTLKNYIQRESTAVLKKTFYPETELSKGEVLTYDILKVSKSGESKIIPLGRRTRMGRLAEVEKSIAKIEYNQEIGLQEYEKYAQRFSFVDTSFPRFQLPKKAQSIKGIEERYLVRIPEERVPTNIVLGNRRELTVEELEARKQTAIEISKQAIAQEKITRQAIKQAQVSAALNYRPPVTRSNAAILKQLGFQQSPTVTSLIGSTSAYAGLGLYEQTAGGQLPPVIKEIPKELPKEIPLEINREILRDVQREINREITREVSREVTREIPREISREVPREVQREIQRLMLRQIARFPPSSPPKGPESGIVSPPPRNIPKAPIIPSGGTIKKRERLAKAYAVLLKRRGEFIPVARGLPRGRALKLGAESVQKELSRQFKIVQKGMTNVEDIKFRPLESQFRAYQQRRGKRVVTPDQFIQRISNSLSSQAEKMAILRARRKR